MDAETAVGILYRKKLSAVPEEEREMLGARYLSEYRETSGGLRRAVDIDLIDEVIAPEQTVRKIVEALAAADTARGDHSNIPL
jgi:acetyl-CoA/propionyl-CoA carboxylase carboxyl transferase subunit